MLEAYPTKHGTGVEFIGTYNDLASLYDTMNKLSYTEIDKFSEDERLLTIMAYEVRHAFQGDREVYKKDYTFGFKINWVTLLYTISCLRHHQGCAVLNRIDLANLFILEELTEQAMLAFDAKGYAQLRFFIGERISIGDEMTYLIHREVFSDFIQMKTGVTRFRAIPGILIKWSWGSPTYKAFKNSMEKYVKENNCNISGVNRDIVGEDNLIW